MTLSEELTWRGFVNQTTFGDIKALDQAPLTFYWGVDPSADSMHIGQLAMAMMIRHFMSHGYKAILLVGGATGMIGDPDGKAHERDLKSVEEIEHNKKAIAGQYERLFTGLRFESVDNYDWFKGIHYLDFLRDIGKHFSLTQMLDRDFIKSRIGEGGAGISYAEFSYSLIQGYDFLHLYRRFGATLQIAGADQWGNSISGVQLIRKLEGADAHIWTAPLVINKQTGRKFGKSEGGAIWLDPKKTSPYSFYQFWLNVDDAGAADYLKIYTLLNREEIDGIAARAYADPVARIAQKKLAREVTILVHGNDIADSVERVTGVLFGGQAIDSLQPADLEALSVEIPTAKLNQTIAAILIATGVSTSKGEARRLIDQGAISLNGEKIIEDRTITSPSLLKKGKNTFVLVR
jgi:tyrosyl-tRNA synthetase